MNPVNLVVAFAFLVAPTIGLLPAPPACDIQGTWNGERFLVSCVNVTCASYTCSYEPIPGTPEGATQAKMICKCPAGGSGECQGYFEVDFATTPPTVLTYGCINQDANCTAVPNGKCKPNGAPPHINGVAGPVWVPCLCK